MPDQLNDFFQCVKNAGRWEFQVGVVTWDGPHTPETSWKSYRSWSTPPDAGRLARARASAIKEPRFFRTCTRCGELKNVGHMHGEQTCQGCAERSLGIVH
jgi:hypothetical protein